MLFQNLFWWRYFSGFKKNNLGPRSLQAPICEVSTPLLAYFVFISSFQHRRIFLADGWPQVLDDTNARKDWKWQPEFDLEMMCHDILKRLGPSYGRIFV